MSTTRETRRVPNWPHIAGRAAIAGQYIAHVVSPPESCPPPDCTRRDQPAPGHTIHHGVGQVKRGYLSLKCVHQGDKVVMRHVYCAGGYAHGQTALHHNKKKSIVIIYSCGPRLHPSIACAGTPGQQHSSPFSRTVPRWNHFRMPGTASSTPVRRCCTVCTDGAPPARMTHHTFDNPATAWLSM